MDSMIKSVTVIVLSGFILWSLDRVFAFGFIYVAKEHLNRAVADVVSTLRQNQEQRRADTHEPTRQAEQAKEHEPPPLVLEQATAAPPEQAPRQQTQTTSSQTEQADDVVEAIRKQQAWRAFYQPPEKCRNMSTQAIVIECGNSHILKKREFEERWMRGELDSIAASPADISPECEAIFYGCRESPEGCVSLRTNDKLICRGEGCLKDSQLVKGALIRTNIKFKSQPMGTSISSRACIGYREDLGGSLAGAQCLQQLLGAPYQLERDLPGGCSEDRWPYVIHAQ